MAFEKKKINGRIYLYEVKFTWDKEAKRSRKQTVRYLGRCDADGNVLSPPKARVDNVHSAFPAG